MMIKKKLSYKKLTFGIVLLLISLILASILIFVSIRAYYDFNKNYLSYWELSDRSSTLSAKEEYIIKFVDTLNNNRDKFSNYNALILKTPQNKFDNNLKAITTLRNRLRDISKMDETSFEYQTAIQQITAQEQGEAQNIIEDIRGSFYLKSYPLFWDWIFIILLSIDMILLSLGCILIEIFILNYKFQKRNEDFLGDKYY
jgi:hypothetical protein